MKGAAVDIVKEMQSSPRRVRRFTGSITLPPQVSAAQKERLKAFIRGCPVGGSLHPEVKVELVVR